MGIRPTRPIGARLYLYEGQRRHAAISSDRLHYREQVRSYRLGQAKTQ